LIGKTLILKALLRTLNTISFMLMDLASPKLAESAGFGMKLHKNYGIIVL
jgi:hypothetical protein